MIFTSFITCCSVLFVSLAGNFEFNDIKCHELIDLLMLNEIKRGWNVQKLVIFILLLGKYSAAIFSLGKGLRLL